MTASLSKKAIGESHRPHGKCCVSWQAEAARHAVIPVPLDTDGIEERAGLAVDRVPARAFSASGHALAHMPERNCADRNLRKRLQFLSVTVYCPAFIEQSSQQISIYWARSNCRGSPRTRADSGRRPLKAATHWEGDLIICKCTRPVLVLHERKSRVTLAALLTGKSAAETISAMLAGIQFSSLATRRGPAMGAGRQQRRLRIPPVGVRRTAFRKKGEAGRCRRVRADVHRQSRKPQGHFFATIAGYCRFSHDNHFR
jgi:hypothetical protein